MFQQLIGFRIPRFNYRFGDCQAEIFRPSGERIFALGAAESEWEILVKRGESVAPMQPLARYRTGGTLLSPGAGKVVTLDRRPNADGLANVPTIGLELDASEVVPLEAMDPVSSSAEALWERLDAVGVTSGTRTTPFLSGLQQMHQEDPYDGLVVLAVDGDPTLDSARTVLHGRTVDVARAATLVTKLFGGLTTTLALAEPDKGLVEQACNTLGVSLQWGQGRYPTCVPNSFSQARALKRPLFIPLATALDALDAIEKGVPPSVSVLTLVAPGAKRLKTLQVPLGTPVTEVLNEAGWQLHDLDKVLAGGSFTGIALPRLDVGVTSHFAGCTLIEASSVNEWTNEPCVLCGNCVRACPVNLQPHLLGRFAQFSLFDRTRDEAIDMCIECGLCAAACPAHRPLLQWIRLAKVELAQLDAEALRQEAMDSQEPVISQEESNGE